MPALKPATIGQKLLTDCGQNRPLTTLVNRAFLTLVGLDEAGRPSPIPKLTLISDEDKEEWGRAQKRREIRMKQAKEGFHFY